MKFWKKFTLMITVTVCFISLCGCQGQDTADNKVEEEKLQEESFKVIGTESDSNNVYKVKITNLTGSNIVGIAIKASEEEGFVALMDSSDPFVNDETRIMYYEPSGSDAAVASEANASEDQSECPYDQESIPRCRHR